MVNKHTVNYHSSPSESTWKILSYFCGFLRSLSLQNISSACIFHHGRGKILNLWCSGYSKIHLQVKKLNLFIFTHFYPVSSCILILLTPGRWQLLIPPEQRFLKIYFSPVEREGEYLGTKKMTKIKPARVLLTSFDKFQHLCNMYIFGLCLVVPKFRFKHAEVWRFFNL